MKLNAEAKLFAALGAIILLGGAFLFLSSRPPGELGAAAPPPSQSQKIDQAALDAMIQDARHFKGSEDAPLTIVEFADFECPSCRRTYRDIASKLGDTIPARLIFRHLPLEMHPRAVPAALAAEAAGRQDKFWPMYDALFTGEFTELTDAYIEQSAQKIGLDMTRFRADLKDPELKKNVDADMKVAEHYQIASTPTFVVRDKSGSISTVVGTNALMDVLNAGAEKAAASPDPLSSAPPTTP